MILHRDELTTRCAELRSAHKSIVFTNGCFDILHAGHVNYLDRARRHGDVLIVGLNSDESVRRLKGSNRPVVNEVDRATVLDALRSVDYVCIFGEDTPLELVKALQPDVIAKGGDYTPENVVGADVVTARGGRVEIIPFVSGKSSSAIISLIQSL